MFGSAKPLASLSSGLLARKGQAKPAMRRQGYDSVPMAAAIDDLGWNDMGAGDAAAEPVPSVLVEREALARQIEEPAPALVEPEPIAAAPEDVADAPPISRRKACRIARESAAQTARGKAAFTLRLDPERHLRLRLASAVAGASAQQIVAGALDQYLSSMPEVEALAAQLPLKKVRP